MARAAALSGKGKSGGRRLKKQPAAASPGARARGGTGSAFLPPEMKVLLKRSWRRVCGFALALIAGAFLLALLSYAPSDSSWNTQSSAPVKNFMGLGGSWVADAVLQAIGLGGYILALAIAAWACRLASGVPLDAFGWRLLLLPVALLLLVAAFAGIPGAQGWPVHAGPGGAAGRALAIAARDTFGSLAQGWPAILVALGLGIVFLLPVLGLTLREWRWIGAVLFWPFRLLFRRRSRTESRIVRPARAEPDFAHAGEGPDEHPGEQDLSPAAEVAARPLASKVKREQARAGDRKRRERGRGKRQQEPDSGEKEATAAARGTKRAKGRAKPFLKKGARLIADKAKPPAQGDRAREAREPKLDLDPGRYKTPALSLLQEPPPGAGDNLDSTALEQNARYLETVLADFGIKGKIVKVRPGPVVTLYELEPAPGVKSSRVINLADDIARSMSALSVRVAVVPGRNVIGIELPNQNRETVYLREMMAARSFERSAHKLALALGKDIGGAPVLADLAKMPHLLIAGTTGSGKSVAVNTMILSLLYRLPPDRCKFIMIDPKMLELSIYDDIPQLLTPVVTDPKKAVVALRWAVREMENRYRAMSKMGVRNIDGYNQRLAEARKNRETLTEKVRTGTDENGQPVMEERELSLDPLPYIVVIVDEMADLMLVAGKDIEGAVQRLAQMARAAGIHLIMATQRPSVDVITGTIKANFPTRISFQVTTKIDSRTILGEQGAEQLLGQGDMLYMAGGGRITRVHGPFVSDEEVEDVVAYLRTQGEPVYLDRITEEDEEDGLPGAAGGESGGDDLYNKAVDIVMTEGKCSTSFIQRRLQIGYNRAARLVEQMEQRGVVSPANHAGKREVLIGA